MCLPLCSVAIEEPLSVVQLSKTSVRVLYGGSVVLACGVAVSTRVAQPIRRWLACLKLAHEPLFGPTTLPACKLHYSTIVYTFSTCSRQGLVDTVCGVVWHPELQQGTLQLSQTSSSSAAPSAWATLSKTP